MRGWIRWLCLSVLCVLLISCGGGGGSSESNANIANNNQTEQHESSNETISKYLPYRGSLHLVRCSDHMDFEIESSPIGDAEAFVKVDSIDMETGEYENLHFTYMLYIKNGNLYKLDLEQPGEEVPKPTMIPGILNACSFEETVSNPFYGHNILVIGVGSDSNCSSLSKYILYDAFYGKVVDLGNKRFAVELPDSKYQIGKALFCDMNDYQVGYICNLPNVDGCEEMHFADCNVTVSVSVYRVGVKGFDHYYCIGSDLYKWSDGRLNMLVEGICEDWDEGGIAADENYVYGTDGNVIYRVSDNGDFVKIYSANGTGIVMGIYPFSKRLVFLLTTFVYPRVMGGFGGELPISRLCYVEKESGKYECFDDAVILPPGFPKKYRDLLFYNKVALNGEQPTIYACIYDDSTAASQCHENSYWAGYSQNESGIYLDLKGLLLVDDGVLYLTDTSGNKLRRLGVVPSFEEQLISFYGIGSCLLGAAGDLQSTDTDVLFVDLDKEDSLLRITNSTEREFPIY